MAKRNPNNSGSIRQRPDGRWEARITVGFHPGTGKQIRKSFYGKAQKEVRQKMTAALHDIDKGVYKLPSKLKVSEWMIEWLETYRKQNVKPLTYDSYSRAITLHINPALGSIYLSKLKAPQIQRLYNSMIENGLSSTTVRLYATILNSAMQTAVKVGLLDVNPCDRIELPKRQKKEIKPLSDSEIKLFMSEIENSPYKNVFAVCLFCGLRRAEALGLSWDNVDFENGKITIAQQLQHIHNTGHELSKTTKSKKPRVIKPPPITFEYLKAERAAQLKRKLIAGKSWRNEWNLVFTNELGAFRHPDVVYGAFKVIVEKIGRPELRLHDLRHTAATVALASGSDIKSVQALMGHSSASFTLDIYAHTTERMLQDTSDKIQNYYDSIDIKKTV